MKSVEEWKFAEFYGFYPEASGITILTQAQCEIEENVEICEEGMFDISEVVECGMMVGEKCQWCSWRRKEE